MYSAIIGLNPSKGARSPIIWNTLYKALGIDCKMISVDCANEQEFRDKLNKMIMDEDFVGGSIAAPYKTKALQMVEGESKDLYIGGAINNIYREKNYFKAANTDVLACYTELNKLTDVNNLRNILILGFGGTGKPISTYMRNRLDSKIAIYVAKRGDDNDKLFEEENIHRVKWEDRYNFEEKSDLIINCTSLGDMNNKDKNPMILKYTRNTNKYYYDVIYQPEETLFLKQISEKRSKMNGLGMNRLQALIGFAKCHPGNSLDDLSKILDESNI